MVVASGSCATLLGHQCQKPPHALQGLPPGEKVRILEIGSGRGGASRFLMEALADPAERVEFTYTDISPQMIAYGREAYGQQYKFMRFHVLDIERDIAPQVRPLPRALLPWLLLCH